VDVASPVVGLLDKVHVRRGDRISKGQVLATLESSAERGGVALAKYRSEVVGPRQAAQGKLEFSRRKFERRRELAQDKHIAQQERDDAEAEVRQAEADFKVSEENRNIARLEFEQQSSLLALRTLRSPLNGVVMDQQAFPGEVVEPSGSGRKVIVRLAQLDPLRVRAVFPLTLFGKVSVGNTMVISPEIPAKAKIQARVTSIDRLVDASSGTFSVFLDLPNPKLDVPAGVRCKLTPPRS
jgi:RND family efflux transporter MFP subunit